MGAIWRCLACGFEDGDDGEAVGLSDEELNALAEQGPLPCPACGETDWDVE